MTASSPTWRELFDRADDHDVSLESIREELTRRRADGADDG